MQITIVPTILLINKGNSINRIEGLPTEESINEFIDEVKLFSGLVSDETIFQGLLLAGKEFIEEKKYNEAVKSYEEALKVKEFGKKYQDQCIAGLLKSYFLQGDISKADEFLLKIDQKLIERSKEIQETITKITETKNNTSKKSEEFQSKKNEYEEILKKNQEDYITRCNLALHYHLYGFNEEAIEICLGTISLEKSFKGQGQKTIIQILNNLGSSHVLVKPTRKRLQQLYNKYSV